MPDREELDEQPEADVEEVDEQPEAESSATSSGGDALDRRDLDDPQSPNHPMVPPHRVDAEGDQAAEAKKDGQRIHDEAIAAMKRGETVDVSEASDQGDVSGTPSEGVGSNDDVAYDPPKTEGETEDESTDDDSEDDDSE